jgi:hypothetical protein
VTARGAVAHDRLSLGFAVLFAAVVLYHAPRSAAWPWHLAAAALLALLTRIVARAPGDSPMMRFVGPAYPLLLVTAFYTAIGTLNEDVGRNYDLWAQHLDVVVFGGPVSQTWHHAWPWAPLSWALHIGYVSYYPIVLIVGLYIWRRRPRAEFERAVFTIALGFFVCYAVFLLVPVVGPRYFFGAATGAAAEVPPARLVHRLLEGGSAYGTAFPSSHIAASWLAVLAASRTAPKLALALALPAVALALGTVYGQFHYAIDAVVGAAAAIALFAVAEPLRRRLTVATSPAGGGAVPLTPGS